MVQGASGFPMMSREADPTRLIAALFPGLRYWNVRSILRRFIAKGRIDFRFLLRLKLLKLFISLQQYNIYFISQQIIIKINQTIKYENEAH